MGSPIDAPEPWEHESGYHLKGDGQSIKYKHPETEWLAVVQVSMSEGHFLVAIHNVSGSLEDWAYRSDKEAAKELLEEKMEEYA